MTIIDGKLVSAKLASELQIEVNQLIEYQQVTPTLAIIQVGNHSASNVYIRNKTKLATQLGIKTILIPLPEDVTNQVLINEIHKLNQDRKINGILVQMPLPKHINEQDIIANIDPLKDVDCFHLNNIGKLWTARKSEVHLQPCTPAGIIQLLKHYHIPITERKAVVIGRSNIVGKPMASLLLLEDATVTLCHSKTQNLHQICKEADILICAIGKSKMIDNSYIKPGAAVIDVGMNFDESGKLCGDVDYNAVENTAGYLTPVPGGVGPMTVTMLMRNLIELTKLQNK